MAFPRRNQIEINYGSGGKENEEMQSRMEEKMLWDQVLLDLHQVRESRQIA